MADAAAPAAEDLNVPAELVSYVVTGQYNPNYIEWDDFKALYGNLRAASQALWHQVKPVFERLVFLIPSSIVSFDDSGFNEMRKAADFVKYIYVTANTNFEEDITRDHNVQVYLDLVGDLPNVTAVGLFPADNHNHLLTMSGGDYNALEYIHAPNWMCNVSFAVHTPKLKKVAVEGIRYYFGNEYAEDEEVYGEHKRHIGWYCTPVAIRDEVNESVIYGNSYYNYRPDAILLDEDESVIDVISTISKQLKILKRTEFPKFGIHRGEVPEWTQLGELLYFPDQDWEGDNTANSRRVPVLFKMDIARVVNLDDTVVQEAVGDSDVIFEYGDRTDFAHRLDRYKMFHPFLKRYTTFWAPGAEYVEFMLNMIATLPAQVGEKTPGRVKLVIKKNNYPSSPLDMLRRAIINLPDKRSTEEDTARDLTDLRSLALDFPADRIPNALEARDLIKKWNGAVTVEIAPRSVSTIINYALGKTLSEFKDFFYAFMPGSITTKLMLYLLADSVRGKNN